MARLQTVAFVLLIAATATAQAAQRSATSVREFKRLNPCPATGQVRGACPGWVVDHRMPLCAGGEDHPSNMQWQTTAEAKAKDADERRLCRALKR